MAEHNISSQAASHPLAEPSVTASTERVGQSNTSYQHRIADRVNDHTSDTDYDYAVQLRDVSFRRQGRTIVQNVNMQIRPGEHWILFGPNGIGKSTIIAMMATRSHPSSGTVHILGNQLGKVNVFSYRHRIGLSSAELSRSFPPFEDPLDAVVTAVTATTGRWRDTYSEAEYDRARSLMAQFGIGYLVGKHMGRLSEGERTRVLICRSLMADPDVVILDEPTTGLDLGGRELVVRALSELGCEHSKRAVIVVTHRLEEIPQGFDHIALMGRSNTDLQRPVEQWSASERIGMRHVDFGADPAPGTIMYCGNLQEGLTDTHISNLFGMPMHVYHHDGRWQAFAYRE